MYSMGGDGKFCQWSTLRTTERIAEFAIHKDATQPTRQWVESHSGYFPSTPPGNLFAFESEDKYVLTCSPDKGVIYQVTTHCASVCVCVCVCVWKGSES